MSEKKMTQHRFDSERVISFSNLTESVNIIPETGVSYTVSYLSGSEFADDEAGVQTTPNRVFVQNTVVKITPVDGFVTVTGAGSF